MRTENAKKIHEIWKCNFCDKTWDECNPHEAILRHRCYCLINKENKENKEVEELYNKIIN